MTAMKKWTTRARALEYAATRPASAVSARRGAGFARAATVTAAIIVSACSLSAPRAVAQEAGGAVVSTNDPRLIRSDMAAITRGKLKFDHTCAPCHGRGPGNDGRAMLPGTDALRIKYRGSVPPVLEDRSDLTADMLKTFVRQGSWSMPPFRPTEITDAEIEDVAAYLADTARRSAQRN